MAIRMVNTPQTRMRRLVAVGVVALAVVLGPQAFSHTAAASDDAPVVTDTYVVAEGETLWSIAANLTPDGDDVRDTVDTIKTMNRLESANIGIGDQLLVPTLS